MKITTSKGKTFDILFISSGASFRGKALIELEDDRTLSEVAEDFEGVDTITKTDELRPGVSEVYSGYTRLISVQRNTETGTVRLMLEKGDAA